MKSIKNPDTADGEIKNLPVEDLLLDSDNPRFGKLGNEQEQSQILDHIVRRFGVDDILSSLAVNGYFRSEPLVCQRMSKGEKLVVKEGNRRLVACLMLCGDSRAINQTNKAEKFRKIWEQHGKPNITPVPVIIFPDQDTRILSYLGVRHIASIQPWDSYAKAAWVAQVVKENGLSISEISQMIGDQHKTIRRLLEGYYFVQQLIEKGNFQPSDSIRKGRGSMSEYPFSWVYTILGYLTVRKFLGMSDGEPTKAPLIEENLQKGRLVLKSMFGDKSKGLNAAIGDSRELGALARVFSDKEKIKLLKQGKNINEIEYLTQPIEQQLGEGLGHTKDILRTLISRLAEYDISQSAAQGLVNDSSGNKKLAIELDRNIRKFASGSEEDE